MDTNNDFPYNCIEDDLGEIKSAERLCPDFYYVSVLPDHLELPREYYIFPRDSSIFSDKAKAYAVPLPNHPDLLSVMLGSSGSGSIVIQYEALRYKIRNGITLAEDEDLHVVSVYGMEENPEYFGEFPAPLDTPHGATLRYQKIFNGVYSIETEQGDRLIAVAYPLWIDDLSEYTKQFGLQTIHDLTHNIHTTYGYLFFRENTGALAMFELAQYHEMPPKIISIATLKNAVLQYFPEYTIQHNRIELLGWNDELGRIIQSLGIDRELTHHEDRLISWTPNMGTQYLLWQ